MSDWRWLESTKRLQEETYGFDFTALRLDRETFINYVVFQHTALTDELHEFLGEVRWKPWATNRGGYNRTLAVKELVDAAHFLGNLAVAFGVTDEEWERLYVEKQAVNRQRQVAGYDGISGKCPECRRSYDDGIPCVPATVDKHAECLY